MSQPVPNRLNIGSGRMWDEASINIDISPAAGPDIVADLSDPGLLGRTYPTHRFGEVGMRAGAFRHITASHVLEHVPDLVGLMTNCLELLEEGGIMAIRCPYDLSYGAWQDPTHLRGFNERSWLYYTDWHWHIGWERARFEMVNQNLVLSPLGMALRRSGVTPEELRLRPRTVDEVAVDLRKRSLTEEEREAGLTQAAGHLKSWPGLRQPAAKPAAAVPAPARALYLDLLLAWAGEDGGAAALAQVREAAELVLDRAVDGDVVAAGALAAGRGAVLAGVLRSRPASGRHAWIVVDGDEEPARARLARFGLLDARVDVLAGADRDSLACLPVERIALLAIGGEAERVAAVLPAFFDRLAPGGTIIVDPAGKVALENFLARRRTTGPAPMESSAAISWHRPLQPE